MTMVPEAATAASSTSIGGPSSHSPPSYARPCCRIELPIEINVVEEFCSVPFVLFRSVSVHNHRRDYILAAVGAVHA